MNSRKQESFGQKRSEVYYMGFAGTVSPKEVVTVLTFSFHTDAAIDVFTAHAVKPDAVTGRQAESNACNFRSIS